MWETMLNGALKQFSPITWVSESAPPFLLIHGTADTLVPFEQSTAFCNALNSAGDTCTLYPVEGGGHGMRWWESQQSTAYKAVMIDWLKKTLAGSATARV